MNDREELIAEATELIDSWDRQGSWTPDSPIGMIMQLRDALAAQPVLDPEKVQRFMIRHSEAASATGGDAACACDRTWRDYREHAEHKARALCEAAKRGELT